MVILYCDCDGCYNSSIKPGITVHTSKNVLWSRFSNSKKKAKNFCSIHFPEYCFIYKDGKRCLLRNKLPSLFTPDYVGDASLVDTEKSGIKPTIVNPFEGGKQSTLPYSDHDYTVPLISNEQSLTVRSSVKPQLINHSVAKTSSVPAIPDIPDHSYCFSSEKQILPQSNLCDSKLNDSSLEEAQSSVSVTTSNYSCGSVSSKTTNLNAKEKRPAATVIPKLRLVPPYIAPKCSSSEKQILLDTNPNDYKYSLLGEAPSSVDLPTGIYSYENVSSETTISEKHTFVPKFGLVPPHLAPKLKEMILEERKLKSNVKRLQKLLNRQKNVNNELRQKLKTTAHRVYETLAENGSPVFNLLLKGETMNNDREKAGRRWTTQEKENAADLYKVSPKQYVYLSKQSCLPSLGTVKRILRSRRQGSLNDNDNVDISQSSVDPSLQAIECSNIPTCDDVGEMGNIKKVKKFPIPKKWTTKEKENALEFYKMSPMHYKFLCKKRLLPSMRTLNIILRQASSSNACDNIDISLPTVDPKQIQFSNMSPCDDTGIDTQYCRTTVIPSLPTTKLKTKRIFKKRCKANISAVLDREYELRIIEES